MESRGGVKAGEGKHYNITLWGWRNNFYWENLQVKASKRRPAVPVGRGTMDQTVALCSKERMLLIVQAEQPGSGINRPDPGARQTACKHQLCRELSKSASCPHLETLWKGGFRLLGEGRLQSHGKLSQSPTPPVRGRGALAVICPFPGDLSFRKCPQTIYLSLTGWKTHPEKNY